MDFIPHAKMGLGGTEAKVPSPDDMFPDDGLLPYYDATPTKIVREILSYYAALERRRASEGYLGTLGLRSLCQRKKRNDEIQEIGDLDDYISSFADSSLDGFGEHCYLITCPREETIKPKHFESLVPHLALLQTYQTTPIWSLGRLTEAYLLTRQPRVDRTIYGASRIPSQAAACTSNQAQPTRNDLRGEDPAPRTTNVEQQQGQQGRSPSKPWPFRHAQLGSGSLREKRLDHDGRRRGEDGHALSGTTTKDNGLAGSEHGAGVDGGTREVLTDHGGDGTGNFERGTEMYDIARDRRSIWMTTSTENQPRNRHTTRDNAGYQVNKSISRLRRLDAKATGLSMLSLLTLRVSADEVHHRAAKVAATAVSALVSLGTGMTSLQLEIDSSVTGTRVAKMCLRIFSSTFLLALIGCFMHWFCAGAERTKRFISAAFAVLFFGWVVTRVVAAPSAGDVIDAFSWLDKVNLFGLLAAVAGIINVRTDGMLQAEVDEALGSGASANPLLPLAGNNGPGPSELQSGGEESGDSPPQPRSEDSAA
jgi:hypothetical protein